MGVWEEGHRNRLPLYIQEWGPRMDPLEWNPPVFLSKLAISLSTIFFVGLGLYFEEKLVSFLQ